MRELDLAVVIRQHERFCALKDAEPPALKTRGVFAGRNPFAARFDADHADRFVSKKRMEQSDGVAAAANACDEQIGKSSFAFQNLFAGFEANHALKITHHHGVGMGPQCTA